MHTACLSSVKEELNILRYKHVRQSPHYWQHQLGFGWYLV
jgi:hypothetical protein